MRELRPLGGRQQRLEIALDLVRVVVHREAETVREAANVRVDEDRRLAECGSEHDVGGLAADAGKGMERVHGLGDPPGVPLAHGARRCLE